MNEQSTLLQPQESAVNLVQNDISSAENYSTSTSTNAEETRVPGRHPRQTDIGQLLQQLATTQTLTLDNAHMSKLNLRNHRLMPNLYQLLCQYKEQRSWLRLQQYQRYDRERIEQTLEDNAQLKRLDNMLIVEGIAEPKDEVVVSSHVDNVIDHEEYRTKLANIKKWYDKELAEYEKHCNLFISNTITLLREQSQFRPISGREVERTIQAIRKKMNVVQIQLKQQTCEYVMNLRTRFLDARRKRRNFSREASEILNVYFYSHLSNPYPSEEAKEELARQCNITVSQVTNWFGNKRIRYKKNLSKSQEEAAHYAAKLQASNPPTDRSSHSLESKTPTTTIGPTTPNVVSPLMSPTPSHDSQDTGYGLPNSGPPIVPYEPVQRRISISDP